MNMTVNRVRSSDNCDVAIIGAGPYGLATAAHLRAAKVSIRVFGQAMSFWRQNMPTGMKLRSPWVATHIADPRGRYLLDDYYRQAGMDVPGFPSRIVLIISESRAGSPETVDLNL